jgi:hypothetical protein
LIEEVPEMEEEQILETVAPDSQYRNDFQVIHSLEVQFADSGDAELIGFSEEIKDNQAVQIKMRLKSLSTA